MDNKKKRRREDFGDAAAVNQAAEGMRNMNVRDHTKRRRTGGGAGGGAGGVEEARQRFGRMDLDGSGEAVEEAAARLASTAIGDPPSPAPPPCRGSL